MCPSCCSAMFVTAKAPRKMENTSLSFSPRRCCYEQRLVLEARSSEAPKASAWVCQCVCAEGLLWTGHPTGDTVGSRRTQSLPWGGSLSSWGCTRKQATPA